MSKREAPKLAFAEYVAIVRKRGFLFDTVCPDCSTNPPLAGVPRDRVNEWLNDHQKRALILNARDAFLASQPPPLSAPPPFAAAETQPASETHRRLGAEGRKLLALTKELDSKRRGSRRRPRAKQAKLVSEAEERRLLALGLVKETFQDHKDSRKIRFRIVFGGKDETRLIFTPYNGAWMVAMEGNESLEELRRELNKAGRNLSDVGDEAKKRRSRPDIAFTAVEELLECFEQFKALPPDEQRKVDARLAIVATLNALEQRQGRKLQLAFDLLTDDQWPRLLERLRNDSLMLSVELQRPPSKKELKDRFDSRARMHPSEFAKLLKHAGLAWLRRDRKALNLGRGSI